MAPDIKVEPARGARLVGESINAQGNELAFRRREPGRILGKVRAGGRPDGLSGPRFTTGVRPLPSITGDVYLPRS